MTKRARPAPRRPPTTLWIPSASLDRQHARLHRDRRPACGTPGCSPGMSSAAWATSRASAPRNCSLRAEYRRLRAGLRAALAEVDAGRPASSVPITRTSTPRWRTGSPGGSAPPGSGFTPAAPATTRSPATSGSTSRTVCCCFRTRRSTWSTACSPSPQKHQRRALARIHPPAARHAFVGGALGRGVCRGTSGYRRDAARRSGPGRSLSAGQRRGLRRPAAASSARWLPARSDFAEVEHNVASVQNGRGKLEAGGPLLVHAAGPRARQALQRRHPLQRRRVRIPGAAGRPRYRVQHHAAQAESRSLRADPEPGRGARGRAGDGAADQERSSPAAITATSSCSRNR